MSGQPNGHWQMLHENRGVENRAVPSPRDAWGGMLAYQGSLLLFGGATTKYGPATRPGDLTSLGTLNDLWRYDSVWLSLCFLGCYG